MCVVRGAAVGPVGTGRSNRPFAKRMQVIRVPISMPTDGNSSGRFYDPEIRAEISRRPKERITVEGTYYRSGTAPSPFRLPKSAKCDADHIRRGVSLIYPGSRDASFAEGECYDLEFRPHERSALRNSRHAAGDGVDLRSGVRREPRRSGMPAAITRPGRY